MLEDATKQKVKNTFKKNSKHVYKIVVNESRKQGACY